MMKSFFENKSKSVQNFINIMPNSPITVKLKEANEKRERKTFVRIIDTLDGIAEFIERNEDSNIVIQLKESNDIEASYQLIAKIRKAIQIEREIEREEQRIQSHVCSIKDISREIRIKKGLFNNAVNRHKIKRCDNE